MRNSRGLLGLVPLLLFALLAAPTRAVAQSETIEYYGTDAVGSVRIVFNASGTVLGRQEYDPFGREILSAWGVSPERFGGQTTDGEVQQANFHARQFLSRIGRFEAADPIGADPTEPRRWNRYTYALNNPVRFVDFNGLDPKEKPDWHNCAYILSISPNDYICNPPIIMRPMNLGATIAVVRDPAGKGGPGTRGKPGSGAPGTGSPANGTSSGDLGEIVTVTPDSPISPIVNVCGGGVFGYAGFEAEKGPVGAELIGIVQYDSEEGGSHGGVAAVDVGNDAVFGGEFMRTWSDWEEHDSAIAIQNVELSASRRFGRHMKPGHVDVGGIANIEDPGKLSLGLYAGGKVVGGGAYVTLSARACR